LRLLKDVRAGDQVRRRLVLAHTSGSPYTRSGMERLPLSGHVTWHSRHTRRIPLLSAPDGAHVRQTAAIPADTRSAPGYAGLWTRHRQGPDRLLPFVSPVRLPAPSRARLAWDARVAVHRCLPC